MARYTNYGPGDECTWPTLAAIAASIVIAALLVIDMLGIAAQQ